MYLIADAAGITGVPHAQASEPGQDYYVTHVMPYGAVAVVSDGCSHGEDEQKLTRVYRTDVGARIVALATARAAQQQLISLMQGGVAQVPFIRDCVRDAQEVALRQAMSQLGLDLEDLLATWLLAMATPDGRWQILGEGDGVAVIRHPDKQLDVYEWQWTQAGAFYPAMRLGSLDGFIAAYGGIDGEEPAVIRRHWHFDSAADEDPWQERKPLTYTLANMLHQGITLSGELVEGMDVAVFSDGIAAWQAVADHPTAKGTLPVTTVAQEFTKRLLQKGNRRVRNNVTAGANQLRAKKYMPEDDFSMAAISALEDLPPTQET